MAKDTLLNQVFKPNPDIIFSKKNDELMVASLNPEDTKVFRIEGRLAKIFLSLQKGETLHELLVNEKWENEISSPEDLQFLEKSIDYLLKNNLLLK